MSQYDTTRYAHSSPPVGTRPPRVPVLSHYAVIGASALTTAALVASALVLTLRTGQLSTWWEHGGSAGESTLLLVGVLGAVAMLGVIAAFVATSVWFARVASGRRVGLPGHIPAPRGVLGGPRVDRARGQPVVPLPGGGRCRTR